MPSTVTFAGRDVQNHTHAQWWRDPGLRRLNFHLLAIMFGTFTVGYDGVLMNSLLSVPRFLSDLGSPDSNLQGLMTAGMSIAEAIMPIPSQWLMDKFGRRRPVQAATLLVFTGALVQVCAKESWYTYFIGRLLLGAGMTVPMVTGSVHMMELAHPRQASKMGAWFGGGYFFGAITCAWLAFGCLFISSKWSWKIPSLVQIVPAIYQLIFMNFTPESPRWLIANGREEEARAILAEYHANGYEDDPLVLLEVVEIKTSLQLEKQHFAYVDFFKTAGNRKRLFLALYIGTMQNFAGNGIISYYLSPILKSVGITSAAQQQGINGSLQIWSFLVAVVAILISDQIGRRKQWLASFIGCFISYVLLTICSGIYAEKGNLAAGSASVAWIFTFNGSYVFALTILPYSYVAELMPFHIRSKASALHISICAAVGVVNQYMNPVAFEAIGWKYYPVYLVLLGVSIVVVYFVFPETAHLTLEESAHLLDGEDAEKRIVHAVSADSIEAYEDLEEKA